MSEAKAKRPVERVMVKLVDIARSLDVATITIRDWVSKGEWPEPHSIVGTTWFWRARDVDHWVRTGQWPDGVKFKTGVGRGRQTSLPA